MSNGFSNSIFVIDIATNNVTATTDVENYPYGIAVDQNGTKVYVAGEFSDNISIIDNTIDIVTDTVNMGTNPACLGTVYRRTNKAKLIFLIDIGSKNSYLSVKNDPVFLNNLR